MTNTEQITKSQLSENFKKESLEKILISGIIKYYPTSESNKIIHLLNKSFYDKKYHFIIDTLLEYDFIDIKEINNKDISLYKEDISLKELLYYFDKYIEIKNSENLKNLKKAIEKTNTIEDISSLILDKNNFMELDSVTLEDSNLSTILEKNIDFLYSFKGKTTLGSPIGIESLDEAVEGIFGLVGLTATPGAGKTTLAVQTAYYNAFVLKKPVIYITLEVNEKMFMRKFISFMTQIPLKKLLKNYLNSEETIKFHNRLEEIKNNKYLYILDNKYGMNFLKLMKHIKEVKEKTETEDGYTPEVLVILDYLNLFNDYGTIEKLDQNQKIANQMKKFIEIKNDTNTNFLLIASKNKQGYDQAQLSSIKGPNDLEYAFECIISLEKPKELDNKFIDNANIIASILKSRWGEAFINIPLKFDGKTSRFTEINKGI